MDGRGRTGRARPPLASRSLGAGAVRPASARPGPGPTFAAPSRAFQEAQLFKTRLLNRTVHALATPLTPLSLRFPVLRRLGPLNPRQQDCVAAMETGMSRLASVVSELTAVAQLESGVVPIQEAPVELRSLLADLSTRSRPAPLRLEPCPPVVCHGDATRLRDAFSTLIEHVAARAGRGVRARVHRTRGAARVRFAEDNGETWSKGRQAVPLWAIADPGADPNGSRAMLAMFRAEAILMRHGGAAWSEAEDPRTVCVLLPRAPGARRAGP